MVTADVVLLATQVIALAAIGIGALLFWLWTRPRAGWILDRLEQTPDPSVVTGFSGRIVASNDAMTRICGSGHSTIETLLEACLDRAGASAIYRLSQTVRSFGFAVMPVLLRDSAEPRYLTVTEPRAGTLLWSLLPTDTAARMMPALVDSPYETAPFAHMRERGPEPPLVNAGFRRLFGTDPAPVLAALPDRSACRGGRVALTTRDGALQAFHAFLDEAAPGERELFLFPAEEEHAPAGPTRILELVPIALAQFDISGRLLWCNGHAREVLGRHAVLGANLDEIFAPLGQAILPRADAPGSNGRGQMAQLRGTDAFVQISITRVDLGDRPTMLAVLTDASQLRQLQDQFTQSQKMEAVGKLAGGVAHDFNNVLTAIVGHCDLLLLTKDASHPDYADLMQITQNANRAAALVRQLLAFSRKQTLNPEILSVQDIVSETHYLLTRLLGETVTLHLEMAPGLWTVRADHQQLEQVLMNLVVNARDAMQANGTVTIHVRNVSQALPAGEGGTASVEDYVEIAVTDTGPGIDPAVIDKVFDPFFTTKPKGEGTGLGLSTVYGIVKQSGGYIFAENGEAGGARFRILLPRAEEEARAAGPAVPAPKRRDLTGKGSVLLVEDEAPVRAFAARALRLRGYEVVEAGSAEEATEVLEDDEFLVDLIVSDVVMPGMDGPTFAVQARKMRPGLRFILVSGYAEESFRRNLADTDFLFLPKPFSLNELTATVKEALAETEPG